MAMSVVVPGRTLVRVGLANGSVATLGYSRDRVDVVADPFYQDVPGDQNGGDAGPPIEVLYLGEIARVRCELSKFDPAVAATVSSRVYGATAGTPAATGTTMFAGTRCFTLILDNANAPRTFPRAVAKFATSQDRSSKYSTFVCEFECHKNAAGVLYTTAGDASAADTSTLGP